MPGKHSAHNNIITVSIVTYNSADEIDVLMKSIEENSLFHDMMIYVVDNASSDNTVKHINERYPWANIIVNKTNIGFGKAHNLVIRNIDSKYHIIANPDISIPADTIEESVSYMENNPGIALLTPHVLNFDGTQQFLPKRNPSIKYLLGGIFENTFKWAKKLREEYTLKDECISAPKDVEFCTGAFMFARTDALHKVGGFDERYFLHFEDADLTRELRKIGRTVYHPNIKIYHKWHRDNKKINRSFLPALQSMLIYMKKWNSTNA